MTERVSERVQFGPYTELEAVGGLCTCLVCGSAVMLDHRDEVDPLELHRAWHRKVESPFGGVFGSGTI